METPDRGATARRWLVGLGAILWGLLPLRGSAQQADIAAPRLLCPRDGMAMTDVASFFRWARVPGCTRYEIQIAADPEFKTLVRQRRTENVRYHEECYFPKDVLPAGAYFWRVRALADGLEGPWSETYRVSVNAEHPVAARVVREIGPERPLFLMRAAGFDPRAHGAAVPEIIPPDLAGVVVPDDMRIWDGSDSAIERARAYEALGIDFVVWNNRARAPLSLLEYLFQTFPHCIGTAEGEHFYSWGWERGPEGNISEWDYVRRAWILCAKYGRLYFFGDGEAATYKWTIAGQDLSDAFRRGRRNVVPMFKSTISNVALHSLGAVEGLMAAGTVENCGFWADEWFWPLASFGKLGEIDREESRALRTQWGTRQCPWTFDIQMWLMGIAAGSTAFHLESAHQWTGEGKPAANYTRFFLPFVQAVVRHRLIPSRPVFLESLKVAVACDYERARRRHEEKLEPDFAFLRDLYALKRRANQEIIPDEGRYGIICLLPPSAGCLNRETRVVPQEQLLDPQRARDVLNRAYPRRFEGDAFMWECDGTVVATNSNENLDVDQRFSMPLQGAPVQVLAGTVGVHQYLIGKVENGRFWFQTNAEEPERDMALSLTCARKPQWSVVPPAAARQAVWDEAGRALRLVLSHRQGAVEVTLAP